MYCGCLRERHHITTSTLFENAHLKLLAGTSPGKLFMPLPTHQAEYTQQSTLQLPVPTLGHRMNKTPQPVISPTVMRHLKRHACPCARTQKKEQAGKIRQYLEEEQVKQSINIEISIH